MKNLVGKVLFRIMFGNSTPDIKRIYIPPTTRHQRFNVSISFVRTARWYEPHTHWSTHEWHVVLLGSTLLCYGPRIETRRMPAIRLFWIPPGTSTRYWASDYCIVLMIKHGDVGDWVPVVGSSGLKRVHEIIQASDMKRIKKAWRISRITA